MTMTSAVSLIRGPLVALPVSEAPVSGSGRGLRGTGAMAGMPAAATTIRRMSDQVDPAGLPGNTRFPRLFSPLRIGPLEIRNRIFSSGHDTVMAEDGLIGDRLIAYQQARAAGGVGLIVVQVASVHPTAEYTPHAISAMDDTCIPGYRRLAAAVHAEGAAIIGQVFHGGRELMDSEDGTLPVALAPSVVPNERFHVMPRAMSIAEIHMLVAGFADAARRLRTAGLDGVEIVASHGYLPAQFLSPRVNLRTDEYGGSLENRVRFLRETIAAVRAAMDPDAVVGLRISIDERSPEGLTRDESLDALASLDADGGPDYVSVVAGTSATLAGSDHIVPPMTMPNAYTAPLAAATRARVRVPVLVAGRVNQPQEAEHILELGQADAVAMTRALISDPRMPSKAAAGLLDEIRACVGCNQACIGHFHTGYPISCIQYPESGRELWYGRRSMVAAADRKRVLVVGGGPAGLKAAAVAAERGHDVTLHDAGRRVGGQVLLAQELPGRAEFGGVITNLQGEAERAGVRIVTGSRVDAAQVAAEGPDVVIVATGAVPFRPALELVGDPSVFDAWQVIRGADVPMGRVVVVDWRCDWVGPGVALLLAAGGRRVTLASNGYTPGFRIQQYVRDATIAALNRAHVEIIPLVRPFGYDGTAVFLQHTLTDEAVIVEDVAALVLASGHQADAALYDELAARTDLRSAAGRPIEIHGIGDCLAARTVEEAVLDGLKVASAI
jgi:2,4-dienoyl-CoA reductase-like NADH-dependent reductase (Old Yellow Enzyme family)